MLKGIKDNPNLVKDTDNGAILSKPQDDKNSIQIRNLKKKVQELEKTDVSLYNLIVGLNKRIEQLEKLHYDKSN